VSAKIAATEPTANTMPVALDVRDRPREFQYAVVPGADKPEPDYAGG
jgi:hypothetical protein